MHHILILLAHKQLQQVLFLQLHVILCILSIVLLLYFLVDFVFLDHDDDNSDNVQTYLLKTIEKQTQETFVIPKLRKPVPFESLIPYKHCTLIDDKLKEMYPFWPETSYLHIISDLPFE